MQKTPDKLEEIVMTSGEKTPKKSPPVEKPNPGDDIISTNSSKITTKTEFEFRTPEKTSKCDSVSPSGGDNSNKNNTPDKNEVIHNTDLKSEQTSCEGEDGMISTTEQARLLIAANKTPSKCVNKTPVKDGTPSGRRSVENSPGTPGKYKRVNLITLASPKAKRIKQI